MICAWKHRISQLLSLLFLCLNIFINHMHESVKFHWEDFFSFPERGNPYLLRCPVIYVLPLSLPCLLSVISPVPYTLTPQNDVFWELRKRTKMAQIRDPLKVGVPFFWSSELGPDASLCFLHITLLNLGCRHRPWLSPTQTSRRIWQIHTGDQTHKKDIFLTHYISWDFFFFCLEKLSRTVHLQFSPKSLNELHIWKLEKLNKKGSTEEIMNWIQALVRQGDSFY